MQKVIGRFNSKDFAIEIDLCDTNKEESNLFSKIKEYYTFNMFLAFRPQASKLRKILITSVGDHLDLNDEQNAREADLCFGIELHKDTPVSSEAMLVLDKLPNWNLVFSYLSKDNIVDKVEIIIRKTDSYILRD